MNAAKIGSSARLRRALIALEASGGWMSTRDLIWDANICAVNSVIAELRVNGCRIETKVETDEEGRRRWFYRLTGTPEGWRGS
jgi:hypothetical protein